MTQSAVVAKLIDALLASKAQVLATPTAGNAAESELSQKAIPCISAVLQQLLSQSSEARMSVAANDHCCISLSETIDALLTYTATDSSLRASFRPMLQQQSLLCLFGTVTVLEASPMSHRIDAGDVLVDAFDGNVAELISALHRYLRLLLGQMDAAEMAQFGWLTAEEGKGIGRTLLPVLAARPIRVLRDLISWSSYYSYQIAKAAAAVTMGTNNGRLPRRQPPANAKTLADTTDQDMAHLTAGFASYVSAVTKAVVEEGLLEKACEVTQRVLFPTAVVTTEAIAALVDTLSAMGNAMSYTTLYSAQLRKQVASAPLFTQVAIPLLAGMVGWKGVVKGRRDAALQVHPVSTPREATLLLTLVRSLSELLYNVRVLRPALAAYPLLGSYLCRQPYMWASDSLRVEYFALVIRLVVNAELAEAVSDVLALHATQLDDHQRHRLANRLSNPKERMYPMNVFCDTYLRLRPVFSGNAHPEGPPQPAVCVSQQPTTVPSSAAAAAGSPLPPPSASGRSRKRNQRRRAAQKRRYQRLRVAAVSHPSTSASDHHLTTATTVTGVNETLHPITEHSREANDEEASFSDDSAFEFEQEEEEGDVPIATAAAATTTTQPPPTPPTAMETSGSTPQQAAHSDEDLPPSDGPFNLLPWRTHRYFSTVLAPPARYLCALSLQLLQVPVILPCGEICEKGLIQQFLKQEHNRCPFTGEELYASELVVDLTLQRELDVVRGNYV